jgi:hypothetical protein
MSEIIKQVDIRIKFKKQYEGFDMKLIKDKKLKKPKTAE